MNGKVDSNIKMNPCPHCGKTPCWWSYGMPLKFFIGCPGDGNVATEGHLSLKEAIVQWNDWIAPEKKEVAQ